jgi:voltage-gated potassium channel
MPLVVSTLRALRMIRHDRQFRSLAFLSTVAIVSGTVFYSLVEGLRVLDAFYFSVLTLTTVGYGDFTPKTDAGKLFTAFYVLIGVGMLLSFVTRVAAGAVDSHADRRRASDEDDDEITRRRAA